MEIGDFTTEQSVIANMRVANKAQALKDLARRAASATGLGEQIILTALLERERLGSTGIGKNIALPHARIRGLNRIYGFFARLDRPIDFHSVDEKPVDLIFLLLAPEDSGKDHLAALALVSRLFRDPDACVRLRHAESVAAIYEILTAAAPG